MKYYRNNDSMNWSGGIVMGLVLGALAGLFLSPKSGKENREEVKKRWSEMMDRGGEMYHKARSEMDTRMKDIKGNIDESKYMALMKDVMGDIKTGAMATADEMGKTRERLMADFRKLKKTEVEDAKKISRNIRENTDG